MERKKIAVVLSRFPYPLDKGDRLRAYHQLVYLSKIHDIYLFCLHDEAVDQSHLEKISGLCKKLYLYRLNRISIAKGIIWSFINRLPIQVGYFFSKNIKRKMRYDMATIPIDTVYSQLSRTAYYTKDLPYRRVIDFQDAFSTNYLRLSENTRGIFRWFYKREHRTMQQFERNMLDWFHECTIISAFDKAQIDVASDHITVIPNGVDTTFFQPVESRPDFDILFVGNLSYLPNKTAALYLIKKIIPALRQTHKHIKLNIAGADTPPELFAMADANIVVSGFAPDIRDVYQQASVFVAPLFTGAGLQNKILEAMSMGLPCITTDVVNASLQAKPDLQLLIANDEAGFVQQIKRLLQDAALRRTIREAARDFVEKEFSWQTANEKLNRLL